MIVVNIKGGLGNQMFQYAHGRMLSCHHNTQMKLDTSSFCGSRQRQFDLNNFNIKCHFASLDEILKLKYGYSFKVRFINRIFSRIALRIFKNNANTYIEQTERNYDHNLVNYGSNLYLEGYWQSEKYFCPIKKVIQSDFIISSNPPISVSDLLSIVHQTESVSIHVRRTDYLLKNRIYNILDVEYYHQAYHYICQHIRNPSFFIFSDDVDWCMKHFTFIRNPVFVSNVTKEFDCVEDFRIMLNCKHNIIANSTFSWWAAWLNQNPSKIIIAPLRWFNDTNRQPKDLLPANWIKL